MSATASISPQVVAPLLAKTQTLDESTHVNSDKGSSFVKDVSPSRPVRSPIGIREGSEPGTMMNSQEMAISMPRNEYAGSSGVGTGQTLLYQQRKEPIVYQDREG
jgi:hypothetical protein